MKKLLLVLGVLIVGASLVRAEALTADAAVDRALRVNVDYQNALLTVDRARNSLVSWVNWKGIAVSATQKQTSGSGTSGTPGAQAAASTTTLGLNLPLFDQLGASVTVDQDRNAQVSVNLNPLAHSDNSVQARISYEKAVLSASQARITLETAVRKAYWAQAAAEAQVTVQTKRTVLKETAYQDAKARYAKGNVTLAEVRTALQDWIQARTAQTALERTRLKARSDLAGKLQGEIEVTPVDSPSLEAAVKALGEPAPGTGLTTAVKAQVLDAEAAQAKADAVWWLDPGLTVSGSASLPAQGNLTWSGSVTLTFALGDWQGAEKAVADRSAELARQTLEAQQAAARSSETQARLTVESAADTVETRTLALAQAKELQTETRLLVKAGEATAMEAEEADLGVASAEIDLFSAWADLYGAKLDLAALTS